MPYYSEKQLPPDRLSDSAIAALEPRTKPAKHGDGHGLYLQVNPNGSRYWRFRYRFNGKQNNLSCGVYPAVSLKDARARRDEFRMLLVSGVNPSGQAAAERSEQPRSHAEQFAATRFYLDNDGALTVQLGKRRIPLNPQETVSLRAFLDATSAVPCKVKSPCL